MKRYQKTIAVVLVITTLVLASCGGAKKTPAEETSSGPVTLSLFVADSMWPYNDWTGTMPKWATEQTGVTLDVTVGSDPNELPVMIASGAMPDLIIAPSQFFGILSNQNVCYDWGGLYEQYNLSTQIHPAYQFVNRATDGKFYTVQVGWSAPYEYKQYPEVNPETNGGAAREDILKVAYEKLGISQIKSIKDLEGALQVCKDEFPGIIPYAFQSDWSKDSYMENLYGLAGSGFVDDGTGKAMLWIKQPLRKDYYIKLNEWARKGFILEETYSWTAFNTLYETAIAGNVFFAAFHCTTGDLFDQLSKSAGADYTWEQMDDLETPNLKFLETSPGWRGLYITKNCKNPEAAIRFADFMAQKDSQYTMMWGFEGEDWKWNADKTVAEFTYDITLDSEKVEEMQLRWGWIVHDGISNNMYTVAKPGKTNDGKRWGGDHTVRMPTLGLLMNKMDVESEEYIIYENLRELENNAQTSIIFAPTPEEAAVRFDRMMAQVEQMGAAKVEEWANSIYPDLFEGYNEVKDIGAEGWKK